MRRIIYYTLHFCTILLLFSACSEEDICLSEGATIQLSISSTSQSVNSRTVPKELDKPIQEAFHLRIVGQELQEEVHNGPFESEVGPFRPDTYTIDVECGENILALDAPYYTGSTTAKIFPNFENTVNVEARVANALLSVEYEDAQELDETFNNYAIVVSQGNLSVELKGNAPSESAYMPAGSTCRIAFRGTKKSNGSTVEKDLTNKLSNVLPLQEGEHLKITLKLSNDAFDITKAEVVPVTLEESIPITWLPKPKVTASGFNEEGKLNIVETNTAPTVKFDYTTSMPTDEVELTLNFEDESYTHLNGTYMLSKIGANAELRKTFDAIGLKLPLVEGTAGTVDLTGLAGYLRTNDGATTHNTIGFRVKANKRWSSESPIYYSINVEKPEFSISVQPEHMWSKEFTADEPVVTTGNESIISGNLTYQYSTDDGKTWYNCNDKRRHKFAKHPDVKIYKVRACYRGKVPSSNVVDVTLETPTQLPNSGMEEWHYTKIARTINTYNPWTSGNSSFWDTNNAYTTRYKSEAAIGMGSYPYNCFPAVSYLSEGVHGGSKAVEIRSTGSGYANSLPSNVRTENRVAGILFTGTFSANSGIAPGSSYTKTDGRDFTSRPTSLSFWYKYAPCNSDTWKARLELWDSNKKVIAASEFTASANQGVYQKAHINLNFIDGQKYEKCKYIYVIFQSTITEGANMQYEEYEDGYALWENNTKVNKDESACWIGSILTIDDIELIYDK